MPAYDCPNCGALEPGVHRQTCSLAGLPVWHGYAPINWAPVGEWLAQNLDFLTGQATDASRGYVVVDAKDFSYTFGGNLDKASKAHVARFGPSPSTGRYLLGKQLFFASAESRASASWPWTNACTTPA